MNKKQTMAMIKATLTQSFDRDRFHLFTLNLVNRMDESKAFSRNRQYAKDAIKPHVMLEFFRNQPISRSAHFGTGSRYGGSR